MPPDMSGLRLFSGVATLTFADRCFVLLRDALNQIPREWP
jgi:hypothetical protein